MIGTGEWESWDNRNSPKARRASIEKSGVIVTSMPIRTHMIYKIYGVILLTIFVSVSGCLIGRQTVEKFVLPEGYTGDVIVLFDQSDGMVPDVSENIVIYTVPEDGILRVKTSPTHWTEHTQYCYSSTDQRCLEVTYLDHWGDGKSVANLDEDERKNGTFVFNDGGIGSFNIANKTIQYRGFLVGHPIVKDRMYDRMVDRIFQLQRQMSVSSTTNRPD